MAHFSSVKTFKPLGFATPLVYFACIAESELCYQILEFAQKLIWQTGNPTAIREFIPRLYTNRLGGFYDSDGLF